LNNLLEINLKRFALREFSLVVTCSVPQTLQNQSAGLVGHKV